MQSVPEQWRQTALNLHFIQRNLDFLLAMGWQGCQAHGPGAILIDADQAVPDPLWEGGITPGLYVSRSLLKEKGLDWPDPDIKRLVRQYDPQTEIVVAILTGLDQDYYRVGVPGRTPASAFTAVGVQLGEMVLRPGELERWTKGK